MLNSNFDDFRDWLFTNEIKTKTISNYISQIKRINKAYDKIYDFNNKEHLEKLLITLDKDDRIAIGSESNRKTALADLKKTLKKYIEFINAKQSTDSVFIGTREDFLLFFGPKLRNIIQVNTRSFKKSRKKCERIGCNNTKLEAAHKHNKAYDKYIVTKRDGERKAIIFYLLDKKYKQKDGKYKVPMKEFVKDYINEHYPIEDKFYFLCKECHKKYDDNKITNKDIIHIKYDN